MTVKLHSLEDSEFATVVSDFILDEATQRILEAGTFKFVLSGGNTPVQIFQQLVKKQSRVDWEKVEIYWLDERCVSVDSIDSNFGSCKRYLIDHLLTKPKTYPMYGTGSPQDAADKYQQLLKLKFKPDENPKFDLILFGIGGDGHVASLFPDTAELSETIRWVVATKSPFKPNERVSLTFPVMNSTRKSLIIAKGLEKKWVYDACIKSNSDLAIPACNINPESGDLVWFVSFNDV